MQRVYKEMIVVYNELIGCAMNGRSDRDGDSEEAPQVARDA